MTVVSVLYLTPPPFRTYVANASPLLSNLAKYPGSFGVVSCARLWSSLKLCFGGAIMGPVRRAKSLDFLKGCNWLRKACCIIKSFAGNRQDKYWAIQKPHKLRMSQVCCTLHMNDGSNYYRNGLPPPSDTSHANIHRFHVVLPVLCWSEDKLRFRCISTTIFWFSAKPRKPPETNQYQMCILVSHRIASRPVPSPTRRELIMQL